ncbi:DUF2071 domain-containing protein [Metabacillus sp. KIGAM252]|uniref:DUF2071 domain-containing protein n=1 Tax=Metabacillus flavus TaxID=2823519 RepID=A0ABS5LIG2_9BACI|nr:DUF2071 domain-containing protein [Metabacillus flavus]MBS2970517.1 DUF2071 domain-containing protein [Metabacillus flavus]
MKWIMKQTWRNLLFVHWAVDPVWLQSRLPNPLKADLFEGQAWIGLVPFEMDNIRLRGLPSMPLLSNLLELNIRTYVTCKNKPGVYFFSLDASNLIGVQVARSFFHLPYYRAKMMAGKKGERTQFTSERLHKGAPPAKLHIEYGPASSEVIMKPSALDLWLTERYCLFTKKCGHLFRGDLYHEPWKLQTGTCSIHADTITPPFRREERDYLHILYAKELNTEFFPFVKLY